MQNRTLIVSILAIILLPMIVFASAPREFAPVQKGFTTVGDQVLPYAPDRLLIKLTEEAAENAKMQIGVQMGSSADPNTGISTVDALNRSFGVVAIKRPFIEPRNQDRATRLGVDRWYMLEFSRGVDVLEAARRYEADPNIEHANPDWVAFPAAVPTDPLYPDHWGHNNTAQLPDLDWGGTYEHTLPNTVGTPGFDANAHDAWDQ